MNSELRTLGDILERARKKGARGAEILWEERTGHSAEVHRSRVLRNTPISRKRLVFRVWLEGGRAAELTATNADGAVAAAEKLFDKAFAAAEKAPEDAFAGPVERLTASSRGLGLEDRRYEGLTPETRLDVITEAERGARNVDRMVLTDAFAYQDWHTRRLFMNSRGANAEELGTEYSCTGTVRVDAGKGELRLDGGISGRTFASISSLPYGVVLARRAMALLGDGPELSGPVRVLFPPSVTAALFSRFADEFGADTLAAGGNFLSNCKIDPRLHLLDDGTLPGALRTTAFDDRGVGPVPLTLLREGEVHGRFLDPPTARSLETRPTGHVTESGQRPRNLILRPGTRSMNAILSDLGSTVLVVDHFVSLDGVDVATGEFSAVCNGTVKEGTKVVGPVRGVRLTGSLPSVLTQVVEVASDTDRHGHVDAPGILLDGFEAS